MLFPFISAELLHSQIPKVWSCTSMRKWFTLALRKCWPAVLYLLWDLTAAKRHVKWRVFPELHVSHSKVIMTAIQPLLYQITVLSFLFPLGTKIPMWSSNCHDHPILPSIAIYTVLFSEDTSSWLMYNWFFRCVV